MHHRSNLGKEAEEQVAQRLEQDGFTILEYNYRKRGGEIDLIATKGSLLVFVEVKMRTQSYFDLGDVITPSKQKKIISTAKDYLARSNYHQSFSYRFDVAFVQGINKKIELTYIPNAFNEGNCTW